MLRLDILTLMIVAALSGCGIDNLYVEVEGGDVGARIAEDKLRKTKHAADLARYGDGRPAISRMENPAKITHDRPYCVTYRTSCVSINDSVIQDIVELYTINFTDS